ncbi:MAG: type I secretion target repeat-containing protein, partial [Rhodobacteraceae bacterium]|nr:type I secretion target repeat-containing protein [Paracoccaceae bacterium]
IFTTDQAGLTAINLAGDDSANEMRGNNGLNRLEGRGGDDRIFGYGAADTIYGGDGQDSLAGGEGDDSLEGGTGQDTLNGEAGDDVLRGGLGDDSLLGGVGNDVLWGEDGNDTLRGGEGADTLDGGDGHDVLYAAVLASSLSGGAGNDTLRGGGGADTMAGGADADTYYVVNAATRIVEAAGGGFDTVRTTVSLALDADAEVEVLRVDDQTTTGALNLTGSASANELRGNTGNNILNGGGGEDSLRGFLGDDTYIVDSAGDRVFEAVGEGNDTILASISLSLGSTVFVENLWAADATATAGLSLTGNLLANDIRGDAGANRLSGGDGDDTLAGLAGNDTLYGGAGTDRAVLNVSTAAVSVVAGATSLVLTSAEGVDLISNDVEYVVFNNATLTYAEVAALVVAEGPKIIRGTTGAENMSGSAGADQIDGLGGNDWINPGTGSDTIDGGDGRDMVSFAGLPDTPGRTNAQYRLDLDLTAGTARTSGPDSYLISNIERVTGTIYADRIKGSAGSDELRGLGDYDWFVATTGADTYDGGTGLDVVSYVEWTNSAPGVSVDPLLSNGRPPSGAVTTGVVVDLGNTANNTNLAAGDTYTSIERITGTGRADVFWGDGNENEFRGLGDYDWFVGSTGGRERYIGGDGVDTVTYFRSTSGVTASLSNGARVNGLETGSGTRGDAALDLYIEIENLVGTNFADNLTGNSGRNTLMGLDGDDFLFGMAGIDQLMGGAGNDTLDGGAGSDYAIFTGNLADYTLTKTASNQVIVTGIDGTDLLIDVEYFRFDDGQTNIWAL